MKSIGDIFSLTGRTALVTGAARGIGLTIAQTLATAGATVILHDRPEEEELVRVADAIVAEGGKARTATADLADQQATEQMLAALTASPENTIDILVLNASVQGYQSIEDFTPEELTRQYEVNIRSSFQLVQGALPGMKARRWGRLLAIGSVNQWKPSPRLPIYATSKAGLSNLMLNCARQYAGCGITANTLSPGVIVTDRNRAALCDEAYRAVLLAQIPAARLGEVGDCAGAALLLCSDAGAYITGTDLPVAGGMQA